MAYDHSKSFFENTVRKLVVRMAVSSTPLEHNMITRNIARVVLERIILGSNYRNEDDEDNNDDDE